MLDIENCRLSKLSSDFDRKSFCCGEQSLDDYLQKFAIQNQSRNFAQNWVLHEENSIKIIGFFTLSTIQVVPISFPSTQIKSPPKSGIPCILIGKLAVDKKFQGQHVGKYLVYSSLHKIKEISKTVGCFAVIVHCLNESLINFYLSLGFSQFVDNPLHLFLPVESIPN